jgi:hypothetical protein
LATYSKVHEQVIYSVGQGMEQRNKISTRNAEAGQTDTRKEEKLAGTSIRGRETGWILHKGSHHKEFSSDFYQWIGRRDPERPRRRWIDV